MGITRKISFSWNLHYRCNYRCPYCFFYERWEDLYKVNVYYSFKQWIDFWDRIYENYGEIIIEISGAGGEPFIYPSFIKIIRHLSNKFSIDIVTNLSPNIECLTEFVKEVNYKNIRMSLSFHPSFTNLESFFSKTMFLKEKGFDIRVLYVAYPPQLKQLLYFKNRFEDSGICFIGIPFRGIYQELDYPKSYTKEEVSILNCASHNLSSGDKEWVDNQLDIQEIKGRLCYAGQFHAHVEMDGKVYRCINYRDSKKEIGNIFDKNFKLSNEPKPCECDICPCEFHWLVDYNITGLRLSKN